MAVETRLGKGNDLESAAALVEADYRFTYQLVLETCAARALNATFAVKKNQVTQWYSLLQLQFLIKEIT